MESAGITKLTRRRDPRVDIIKGIAIICVVLQHSAFPFKINVQLFHMSTFLIASGFCYKPEKIESTEKFKNWIWNKLSGLYIPYVGFNAIFILMYNFLIKINIYTDNPAYSGAVEPRIWWRTVNYLTSLIHFDASATQQLCGADWFVVVLFYILVFFGLLDFVLLKLHKPIFRKVIILMSAIGLLTIGNDLRLGNYFLNGYLSPAFSGYAIFILGVVFKWFEPYQKKWLGHVSRKWFYIFNGIIAVAGGVFFYFAVGFGTISLGSNAYTSPFFLVLCSVIGWLWLYSLACLIEKARLLSKTLGYIGKHTLFVLFLHFISFKIITEIQILIYQEPAYLLASFPVFKTDGIWWIAYAIAGVTVPLCIEKTWRLIKGAILSIGPLNRGKSRCYKC